MATCQFLATEASRPEESTPPPPSPEERSDSPSVAQPTVASKKHPKQHSKHQKGQKKIQIKKRKPAPVEPKVQQLIEMGFPRPHVEYALKELREEEDPRPELVVAWLLDHPGLEVLY